MRTITKLLASAALAASVASFATAASAAHIIDVSLGTSGVPESHPQFTWTENTSGGGTLSSVANETATLYFDNPALAAWSGLAGTTFTLNLVSSSDPLNNGTTLTETGLDGTFSFVNNGTLLLGGTITGGWLQGAIGANSANLNNSSGTVVFTSDLPGLLSGVINESFSFGLSSVAPVIGLDGSHLASFAANSSGGTFSGQMAVPEPATWALMILGLGGAGAMLRQRRRAVALAA